MPRSKGGLPGALRARALDADVATNGEPAVADVPPTKQAASRGKSDARPRANAAPERELAMGGHQLPGLFLLQPHHPIHATTGQEPPIRTQRQPQTVPIWPYKIGL